MVDVIESAAESELSGDDTMAVTKVAYRSHLGDCKSIFHLLKNINESLTVHYTGINVKEKIEIDFKNIFL